MDARSARANLAQGMYRKSTFDDVLAEVEREQLFKVKLPDRTAKIIMESPAIAMLEDDEAGAQQRRINEEEAKQAAIKRAAHESGAPVALLRALEHQPAGYRIDSSETDAQTSAAIALGLDEATQAVDLAVARHRNVLRIADEAGEMLSAAHRQTHPIDYFRLDADDFQDAEEIPIEYTPTPSVPDPQEELRRAYLEDLRRTEPSWMDMLGGAMQTTASIARASAEVAPLARGLVQTAAPVARGLVQMAPIARGGGQLALGTALGTVRMSSHAYQGVSSALQQLQAMGMPMAQRAERFRPGVNIADGLGTWVADHRLRF
jgi:hypothetical protein